MKRLLVLAAMASLLLPALSVAQTNQPQPRDNGQPARPGGGGRPGIPNRPGNPGRPGGGRPTNPNPPARPSRPGKPPPHHGNPARPQPPHAGRPHHRPPHYARPLPPRGNQFWHRGRYYGRVRGPAFIYPPGWHYRAWAIGGLFPPLFLTPNYFYNGYAALGLEAPPPGYAWVRYGPDLVLVNLYTREIEDVVYGVFL